MRLVCIQDPFAAGVEENICSQSGSKHHGAPLKKGIFRFFQIAQPNIAEAGKCHVQGTEKYAEADQQIIASHLITQKGADRS